MSESISAFSQASAVVAAEERPSHVYDPELYARLRFVAFPSGFIELRNPLNRVQSALVHLGPAPGSSPPEYTPSSRDPDEEPSEREQRAAYARQQRECCKIIFEPGETKLIPRELVRALVTVRNGVVIGGLLPFLVIPNDPNPPTYGPAFAEAVEDPFGVPGPTP